MPVKRLTAIAVLLLAAPVPAKAACVEPEDPTTGIAVPAYSLALSTPQPSYARGKTAVVKAQVTSPADLALDGVDVAVELRRSGRLLKTLHARTDSSGLATMRVRLPDSGPSRLDGFGTARRELVAGYDCRGGLVYEYGEQTVTPLLTVR